MSTVMGTTIMVMLMPTRHTDRTIQTANHPYSRGRLADEGFDLRSLVRVASDE